MLEKVWDYVKKYHMLQEQDRVIVGVSGGADSVALFCLLRELQKRIPFQTCVVHVNHNIRGEEALRDAQFVENLCGESQVPYQEYSYEICQMAQRLGIGQEEAGRQARMDAFEKQLDLFHGTKIALAHHKNDLAETMIHHLCRGTGLKGLCGILPVQGRKIRPLLCLDRREIEHYLREHEISYVTDSTNESDSYTRNRIRNHILPQMEAMVNSQSVPHMAQAAEKLRRVDEYLNGQAEKILTLHQREMENTGLDNGFFQEDKVPGEYALLSWIAHACGGRKDVASVHVEQILSLEDKASGKYVELPGGYCVVRKDWGIQIVRTEHMQEKSRDLESSSHSYPWNPHVQQHLSLPEGAVTGRVFPYCGQEIPEKTYTKWLNYDKINRAIQFRRRLPGDYLVVNQEGGRKKLKDYMIDRKIPREQRDDIWLLAMDSEILMIIGDRISEAYKITKDTQWVLEINYQGEE